MKLIDLEQNTPEWQAFRLGKIGGSRLASIWSARPYTVEDIKKLLTERGVDLAKYKQEMDERRGKKKALTKADLELLLTEADKEELSTDQEKKLEYYQILADQVAIAPEDDEVQYDSAMDRGHELEDEACQKAAEALEVEVMAVGCIVADEDTRIYNSPDRIVRPDGFTGDIHELIKRVNSGELIIDREMEAKCLSSAHHLMCYFERKVPETYWTQKVQYFVTNEHLQTLYWVFYNPRIPMLPLFILTIQREDLGHWPETMKKYQMRTLKELDTLTVKLIEGSEIVFPAKAEKGIEIANKETANV